MTIGARARKQGSPNKRTKSPVTRATRALGLYGVKTEGDEAVIDLLADVRHFCRARGFDFEELNRIADGHFKAEGVRK